MSCSSSSAFAVVVVVCSGRPYAGQTMSAQPLLCALRQASLVLECIEVTLIRIKKTTSVISIIPALCLVLNRPVCLKDGISLVGK